MNAGYRGRRLLLAAPLLLIVAACASEVSQDGERVGSQSQAAIGTNLSTYALGSDVVVNYDNMSGVPSDWVAIAEVGTADDKFVKWQYTGGELSGSRTFSGLPGGTYEARAYFDWAGTSSYEVQYRSTFVLANTPNPVLTPPASTAVNAAIQIGYSGLPGSRSDWIAVAVPGSPATSFLRWSYTNGTASGTTNLAGLTAGNYVARAFYDYQNTSSFTVRAEVPFTISGGGGTPTLTPPASPSPSTPINVAFASFPGYSSDWVSVATAGSPDSAFLRYQFTNGGVSGSTAFGNLPDGSYEARGYANWSGTGSYTVIARQPFNVVSCVPESNATFCSRLAAACGSKTANDNCGTSRTVASCGTCGSPQTCGGGGTANVCGAGTTTNVARNKTASGSSPCASTEAPAKAFNGSYTGGNTDKFCSLAGTKFLQVDLGASLNIDRIVVRHAGAGGENAAWNTYAFNLQTSTDGGTFTTVASASNNTLSTTTHTFTRRAARYVRMNITTATSNGDPATRIYEVEVYGP